MSDFYEKINIIWLVNCVLRQGASQLINSWRRLDYVGTTAVHVSASTYIGEESKKHRYLWSNDTLESEY